MVKVSIEVGDAGFRAVVIAESIRRASGIVEDRYPGAVSPLDPDTFFVSEPSAIARIEPEMLESIGG